MIVHIIWTTRKQGAFYFEGNTYRKRERHWEGIFLLGILPIYIKNTKSYYFNY